MVELKEKTVEELRKMASKKKIEGRSKMNKAQLVRALKKTSSGKKTMKRRKMKGGMLDNEQILDLLENPTNYMFKYYSASPARIISIENNEENLLISREGVMGPIPPNSFKKDELVLVGNTLYIGTTPPTVYSLGSKIDEILREKDILYKDMENPGRIVTIKSVSRTAQGGHSIYFHFEFGTQRIYNTEWWEYKYIIKPNGVKYIVKNYKPGNKLD